MRETYSMIIYCSKALMDALKITKSDLASTEDIKDIDPLFGWHGHIAKKGGKNTIALMNVQTMYLLLFRNKLPRNAEKFASLIPEAMELTFEVNDINKPETEAYIQSMGPIIWAYAPDRQMTGNINRMFIDMDYCHTHDFIEDQTIQPYEAVRFNKGIAKKDGIYVNPFEEMLSELCKLSAM